MTDKGNMPSGYDVFRWPEFQAFAKRLGADFSLPVSDISIDLPMDGVVKITQTYLAREMSPTKETTDIFNEKFRTFGLTHLTSEELLKLWPERQEVKDETWRDKDKLL